LEKRITPDISALVLNSPHNTTGTLLSTESVKAVSEIVRSRRIVIVSDEENEGLVFQKNQHISPRSFNENTISIHSFSKTLALAGYRLGYLLVPPKLMEAVRKALLYTTMYPSAASQLLALHIMQDVPDFETEVVRTFERRALMASQLLSGANGVQCRTPQGTPYVWADISRLAASSDHFAKQLLKKEAVAVVPGSAFGTRGEGKVRISTGQADEVLMEGLKRLTRFAESYQME